MLKINSTSSRSPKKIDSCRRRFSRKNENAHQHYVHTNMTSKLILKGKHLLSDGYMSNLIKPYSVCSIQIRFGFSAAFNKSRERNFISFNGKIIFSFGEDFISVVIHYSYAQEFECLFSILGNGIEL